MEEIWNETTRRAGAAVAEPGDSPELARGRLAMVQLMAVTAAQGTSSIVRSDGMMLNAYQPRSDAQIKDDLATASGGGAVVKVVANFAILHYMTDVEKVRVFKSIGLDMLRHQRTLSDPQRLLATKFGDSMVGKALNRLTLKTWKGAGLSIGALTLVGAIAFGVAAAIIWPENKAAQITSATILAVASAASVIKVLDSARNVVGKLISLGMQWQQAGLSLMKGGSVLLKQSGRAGVIGAAVAIALA